jgi:hypothetical protein
MIFTGVQDSARQESNKKSIVNPYELEEKLLIVENDREE